LIKEQARIEMMIGSSWGSHADGITFGQADGENHYLFFMLRDFDYQLMYLNVTFKLACF
jgi:hypothetical protein